MRMKLLLCFIVIFLASCAPKVEDTTLTMLSATATEIMGKNGENPTETLNDVTDAEKYNETVMRDDLSFNIIGCGITQYEDDSNKIDIHYPGISHKIYNIENRMKEIAINAIIKQEAASFIYNKLYLIEDIGAFDNRYKITFLNENVISIFYDSSFWAELGKNISPYAYGSTINIKDEKTIKLTDVITDVDELMNLLESDKFEALVGFENTITPYSEKMKQYNQLEPKDDLITDRKDMSEYDGYGDIPYSDWYIDGSNFIVVINTLHNFDRYSMPLDKIKHIVNPEFLALLQ